LREYTFEGGREDTLNQKKIKILQKYGVSRLSLNPQTFREATLRKINRQFNQDNFDEIYWLSKNTDLLINMDIIIGLPEEKTEDILYTLERLNQYDMDNLTIHSLALKRHARLFRESEERIFLDKEMISRKIMELISSKNMNPYYLYRQKNLIEWGENVGYATEGSESLFNMEMIEENQITVGLGGGAITKIITKDQNSRDLITRYINPKDPALYIREMETRTGEKLKALDAITI
jgi:oxygen-independent coproporphyrinogen-3 oxidase